MPSVEAQFANHIRRYRQQAENMRKSLEKRRLIRNPEKLDALFRAPPPLTRSECPRGSDKEVFEWSYEIKDLALALNGLRHPQPPGAILKTGNGQLTCKITEYFSAKSLDGIVPIKSAELNFVVDGTYKDAQGVQHPLIACWHIDTHKEDEEEAEAEEENVREDNHALHPLFHYQFGGRKLRPNGALVRGVLMLDAPRVPVPPLDLNLAIDFVVTNYLGANWQMLRRDTQYAHPVRESMRRIWAPYYACIANHFVDGPTARQQALKYLPDLL